MFGFRKKLKDVFTSSQDKMLRVNCLHLVPGNSNYNQPHCFMGNGNEGDCFIYLGKATGCTCRSAKFVAMEKKDIEDKVARIENDKAWTRRCLKAHICPKCGHDLIIHWDDHSGLDDGECLICNKTYSLN